MSVKSSSNAAVPTLKKGVTFEDFKPNKIATAIMLAVGGLPAWALPSSAFANNITITGQTQTNISPSGNITDITTSTIKGNTGFNSFGRFEISAGNIVNLHVPTGKSNLVNMVHDAQAVVNGTLNGLKDNKIGGNIIFADPHGMVVGSAGVVNVGSLTITTPNQAQMDSIVSAMGGSDSAADAKVADLVAGKLNGGSGQVKIEGQVNSAGAVNLFAATAVVAQQGRLNAGAEVFGATVNSAGLLEGLEAAVAGDGSIQIVGNNSVEIAGELKALMADGGGANVLVKAPDIMVSGTISTRAKAGAPAASGNIVLEAHKEAGFTDATSQGSPITTVAELQSAITDLSRNTAKTTIDKSSIVIAQGAILDAGHADETQAGNITLEARASEQLLGGYAQAESSITIDGQLVGKDITATALTQVLVESGLVSKLIDSGKLKINDLIDDIKTTIDPLSLEALIQEIKGELPNGGITDAEAERQALEHLATAKIAEVIAQELGVEKTDPESSFSALQGMQGTDFSSLINFFPYLNFSVADASAKIKVGSTAELNAAQNLTLNAQTVRSVDTSNFSLPIITSKLPFNFGVAYGRLSGETTVEVADGAKLAADDLSLLAHSHDTLKVEGNAKTTRDGSGSIIDTGTGEMKPPSNTTTWSAAFSMAHTDLKTNASIERGADLTGVDGDVSVTALSEQSFSNKATSTSVGKGAFGGPAIAINVLNSSTTARFDADLDAESLSVNAANMIAEQSNTAAVQAGKALADSLTAKTLSNPAFKSLTTQLGIVIKSLLSSSVKLEGTDQAESKLRIGSAVAIGVANHQVQASLGGGTAASKQNITLNGDLAVTALQHQRSLHNTAESRVLADAEKDDGNKYSLSVAVSYNQATQHTRALVGNNTNIDANHIGVAARNVQSLDFAGLDRWNTLDEVFTNLKTHVPGLLALPGKIGTSYANATSQGEVAGIAGSVSVINSDIDAHAWVGDNVVLTANATDNNWQKNPYAFLLPLVDKEGNEDPARQALRDFEWTWDAALDVGAANHIQQLGIAGNIGMLLFGSTSDGNAVGGGVNVQVTNNQASAGIGANSLITAKRLDVSALQEELIIGVSPSAGSGASVAGNGSIVLSVVDSNVNASIHNSTRVEADQVGINAEHQLGLWSAAGALAVSSETGVGAGIAVNVLTTDVQALVGDNRTLRATALGGGESGNGRATWLVDELLVNAQSSGQSGAFSVAGAAARTAEEQKAQEDKGGESADQGLVDSVAGIGGGLLQAISSIFTGETSTTGKAGLTSSLDSSKNAATSIKDTVVSVPDKIGEVFNKITSLFDDKPDPGTGKSKQSIAVAGSATVNVSGQKTRAHLGDIVLDPRNPGKGSKVSVLSLNQTNQLSGSGGGAFTLVGGQRSQNSVGVAGAIAYNHLFNLTEASLKNATLNSNDALSVQAASSGDQVAMGLAIAAATAGNNNTAVGMSVSGAVVTNTTRAQVIDSTVIQRAPTSQGIAVNAYDRSRALLGGGSFAISTGANGNATSAGGSLVLGVQANTLEALWLGSTAEDFKRLDVAASNASRLLVGAIAGAVATGANSNAGSGAMTLVVVNNDNKAKVDQNEGRISSLEGGAVNITAQSAAGLSALDNVFSAAGKQALASTGLDLDGNTTTALIDGKMDTQDDLFKDDDQAKTGTTTDQSLFSGQIAGEAILVISGNVAASGKNAVGGAVAVVYTGSDYSATLANTDVTLTGDLTVDARNGTDVLAAAIGAAGGTEVAVSGSSTAVVGRGAINANIDMTGRTLQANNMHVTAFKSGGAYSLAGNITASANKASVGGAISLNDMEQSATAAVENGTYILTGDADIKSGLQSRIMTAALSGSVSGSGSAAVGGAITFNRIADTTRARLHNAILRAHDLSITASQPDLGASIWAIAFNVAASGGSAGVGGGVGVNLILAERSATLRNSDVTLSGSADMGSSLDGEIWSIGIDAAGGSTAGVGGSISVNVIDGEDLVEIDNTRLITTGANQLLNLDSSRGNGLTIASLTGSVKGGGTAAVGGAISVNRIGADRTAQIKNSQNISGFSNASLKTGAKQTIYAIAVAGGGAGTVAVNGSSTSNVLEGTERASVINSTLNVGDLSLKADVGDRTIWSLGGAFGGAGAVAVGVANANNIILSKRIAEVQGSDLTLEGSLTVASGGSSNIRSAAIGAGGAGTAAVGGSVAINVIDGEERAIIDDTTVRAASVTVDVTRGESDIKTLAGSAQGAGVAAAGAAVAISTINQKRIARIVDSTLLLGAGDASVNAKTQGEILTLAIAGTGAGVAAGSFSNSSNNIAAQTRAEVLNSGGSAGTLSINARDLSTIHAGSGAISGAGVAAGGVGTAINRVESQIYATLAGTRNTGWAVRNLQIGAHSAADIIAATIGGGGAGAAAVGGVIATNIIQTLTQANIGAGARVIAQNNIAVSARNLDSILGSAVVGSGAGSVAVSALVSVNVVETNTKAFIEGADTHVSALAKDITDQLLVDSGALSNAPGDGHDWISGEQFNPYPNLGIAQHRINGLAVQASSIQQVGQIALSASMAVIPLASAAISGVTNTTVLAGSTLGYIDGAQINQAAGAGSAQNVRVGANSHSYTAGYIAAVSGGPTAVSAAAGIDSTVLSRTTQARITNTTLNSRGATELLAGSSQYVSTVVGAVSGGFVAESPSTAIAVLKSTTEALLNGGSVLDVGTLKVKADALQRLAPSSASLAGGAITRGGTLLTLHNQSTTRAWIGEDINSAATTRTQVSGGATEIAATNHTALLVNVSAIAGGIANLAGSAAITVQETTTEAGASQVDFGTDQQRLGNLTIVAKDVLRAQSNVGSAAVGIASAGGSANVLVANSATRALFDRASLKGTGFELKALREADVELMTTTGAAGAAALGGSLSLLLLGTGASTVTAEGTSYNAMDELNKGGNGTLATSDSIGSENKVGSISFDTYEWDADQQQYVVVKKTDTATQQRSNNASQVTSADRFSTTSLRKHQTIARVSNSDILLSAGSSVTALDKLVSRNLAGNAVVGGLAVGGAMALTLSNAQVAADVVNTSLTAASLNVSAGAESLNAEPAVHVHALSGSAGLVSGNAAIGVGVLSNTVNVLLDGDLKVTDALYANAFDRQSLAIKAFGAGVGYTSGKGLVLGVAAHDSVVNVRVADDAELSAGTDLSLLSTSEGAVTLESTAASGGIASGVNAAVLVARDQSQAQVLVGDAAELHAGNALIIKASAKPRVSAESFGLAIGAGIGAGATLVISVADAKANVVLGERALLSANRADINAEIARQGNASSSYVSGYGVAGGIGLAANAVVASARNTSQSLLTSHATTRFVGTKTGNQQAGEWQLRATSDVHQRAFTEGYAGGLLTLGAHVAETLSDTTTQALVSGVFSGEIGMLRVSATSVVDNVAEAKSGQGGLVSGAASVANTRDQGVTKAHLFAVGESGGYANFGAVNLSALHLSTFNAFVDSVNAAVLGASGAHAKNRIELDTQADVLAGSKIAANAFDQSAVNKVVKLESSDFNVQSGSGGVYGASAAMSTSDLYLSARSQVGSDAHINVVGDFRNPEHLRISALNDVFARDRVKLDTGGYIALAKADSKVNVHRANSQVNVQSGAKLESVGDIVLSATGVYDISTNVAAKAWGYAGAVQGESQSKVTADYQVNLAGNTYLLGFGDIKLFAGQSLDGGSTTAKLVARTDLWNNTAFPVVNDPNADAHYVRTVKVNVAQGSQVNSVGDIYAHADKGYADLLGYGIAKDLYTAALNIIGLSVERSGGSQVNRADSSVVIDGNLRAGYLNHRSVVIEGLSYWVNGHELTAQQLVNYVPAQGDTFEVRPIVNASDSYLSYRLKEGTQSQFITTRIAELYEQLANYGLFATESQAIQSEIRVLEQNLAKLQAETGYTGENLERDRSVYIFELDPVIAKPGNVRIIGQTLLGSGAINAPGDASIQVINHSSAFLDIQGLEMPYRTGGELYFNNASVKNLAEINAANERGTASLGLTLAQETQEPFIEVRNTYNPSTGLIDADGLRPSAPDIFINGRIFNQRGDVTVTASFGSIYADADIRGKTIAISAGRDFILNSDTPFYHVGGDPAGFTGQAQLGVGNGATVAANNVVISAQYLNINGLIQSGVSDWNVDIVGSSALTNLIEEGRAEYLKGGLRYKTLVEKDARNGTLGYYYDYLTDSIVVNDVDVAGGYMELTGRILSTGNGQLKVLDGFSQVAINNSSGYQLSLNRLDLGTETHGVLRLNDLLQDSVSGQQYVWSTIYTRDYNTQTGAYDVNMREGYSVPGAGQTGVYEAGQTKVADGRGAAFYNPTEGQTYVWLTGQTNVETDILVKYKDKVWGAFPSGDGTTHSHQIIPGTPKPIDGAEYVFWGDLDDFGTIYTEQDRVDIGTPYKNVEKWNTCEAWFIVCHEKRSWVKTTTVTGIVEIKRNIVRADSPIQINFIGHDQGQINVNSSTGVTLLDSLYNQSGSTSITTGGTLTQANELAVIAAQDLTIDAGTGIGSDGKAVGVQVGNLLSASSHAGDIRLNAQGSGVTLSTLETGSGDIYLSAQGDINTAHGAVIKGHSISLSSSHGNIGSAANLINMDSGVSAGAHAGVASVSATAAGGIFVNEVAGDLAVNQVKAGGDIHLRVASGDLVDANTSLDYDTRTLDQLKALWAEMGLTGADADAALAEQKRVLIQAGQNSYERYWQMRTNVDGVVQVFDQSQAQLSADQVFSLKNLGWTEQQIADEQTRRVADYISLHERFDSATGFDAQYQYQLSADELGMLESTASWSQEQLQFSIASNLLNRTANSQVKNEQLNIEGQNITLEANRVGKVLDQDVLIDLSAGLGNLTQAQLAALASAEHDDVFFDDINDKTKIRVVQRDDVNIAARGNLSVTAVSDVFLGGQHDLNLYNIQGDTIHIKTDGNIESANGQHIVLKGHDVVLEASGGNIGGNEALNLEVTGDLTARAQLLNLMAHGNLSINRLTGLNGINLSVLGGDLISNSQMGENLLGGPIHLAVDGNVGSASDRIQLGDAVVHLAVSGDAYLGALQGSNSTAGTLNIASAEVDGLLDIAQTRDLNQSADWRLGGLVLALSNQWNMASGTSINAQNGIFAQVADAAVLGHLTAAAANASIDITARSLAANGSGQIWQAGNTLRLQSVGDVGSSNAYVNVGAKALNVGSSQGALYLNLLGGITSGSLTSQLGQSLHTLGDVNLDQVQSTAGGVTLTGTGHVSIDSLTALQDLNLAGQALTLGTLQSTNGSILARLTGALKADQVHSLNQSVDLIGGGVQLGDVSAATTLTVHTTAGDLTVGSAQSVGNLSLSTAAGSLGNIYFGPLANAATPNGLVPAHVQSTGNILLRTDGDVFGGNAEAQGLLEIYARNIHIGRAQSLTRDVLLQAQGEAGAGNIYALHIEAANDIDIAGSGSLDLEAIRAARNVLVQAGGDIRFAQVLAGDQLSLTGGANITGNLLDAVNAISVDAVGNVDIDQILSRQGVVRVNGGALVLDQIDSAAGTELIADQTLTVGTSNSAASQTWQAGGDISFAQVAAGDQLSFTGGANITGNMLDATNNIAITGEGTITVDELHSHQGGLSIAGNELSFDALNTALDIQLFATGSILLGTSQSGGDQHLQAGEDIVFDRLLAQGQALLDSMINTQGNVLSAGTSVDVTAAGNINLQEVTAPVMSFWAGQTLDVAQAYVGSSIDLSAQDIAINAKHTGQGPLQVSVSGSTEQVANSLRAQLEADSVIFQHLYANDSQLGLTATQFELRDARGVDVLVVQTPQALVHINNIDRSYVPGANVQLHEIDKAFSFKQDGLVTTTDAYVLHRSPLHQVLVPNFSEAHNSTYGLLYAGMTAARYSELMTSRELTIARLSSLLNAAMPRFASSAWMPNWATQPSFMRINLNLPKQASSSEEVSKWEI